MYAVGKSPLSMRGRYLAAVMACGSGASPELSLGGGSAGNPAQLRAPSEVTVPEVSRELTGVRIHRTRMLDPQDFTVLDGIPVTSVARTLLDLAAILRPADLEVAIDRAERVRPLRPQCRS